MMETVKLKLLELTKNINTNTCAFFLIKAHFLAGINYLLFFGNPVSKVALRCLPVGVQTPNPKIPNLMPMARFHI